MNSRCQAPVIHLRLFARKGFARDRRRGGCGRRLRHDRRPRRDGHRDRAAARARHRAPHQLGPRGVARRVHGLRRRGRGPAPRQQRLALSRAVRGRRSGGLALLRRSRDAAAGAWRAAALLAYFGCMAGMDHSSWSGLGPWHALLTVVVILTFLGAVMEDMTGLVWIGALGGLLWLLAVSTAVGDSAGWATAVIVLGGGLVALALLVNRFGRRSAAPPALAPL